MQGMFAARQNTSLSIEHFLVFTNVMLGWLVSTNRSKGTSEGRLQCLFCLLTTLFMKSLLFRIFGLGETAQTKAGK